MPVFKTGAFNRSATSPRTANAIRVAIVRRFGTWIQLQLSVVELNLRFDPDAKIFIIAQILKNL